MTCFYRPSFLLPDTGGQSINDNPKNLTGASPAERPIHLKSHNLNLYQIDHLIVKKNLLNEKNVASAQNLREGLSTVNLEL